MLSHHLMCFSLVFHIPFFPPNIPLLFTVQTTWKRGRKKNYSYFLFYRRCCCRYLVCVCVCPFYFHLKICDPDTGSISPSYHQQDEATRVFQNSTTWPYHSPVRSKILKNKTYTCVRSLARSPTSIQLKWSQIVSNCVLSFQILWWLWVCAYTREEFVCVCVSVFVRTGRRTDKGVSWVTIDTKFIATVVATAEQSPWPERPHFSCLLLFYCHTVVYVKWYLFNTFVCLCNSNRCDDIQYIRAYA